MAHKLKYYTELITDGIVWRLEILQDAAADITPVEIGSVLQSLRLCVQGEQADIDTPIVKTSLEMVFVDAPDLQDDRKSGYWEEFYTSSATEYKVQLYKDGSLEWTGYITPDSFAEELRYRGGVSIVARDNLGALQDYEYDGFPVTTTQMRLNMWDIQSLLNKGLTKVQFPMSFSIDAEGMRRYAYTDDSVATSEVWSVSFNNESLVEKTWYDAIESLLYSTGLVLRYVGGNTLMLCSLRDIPLYGQSYNWDVQIKQAEFCAFGYRELSPAAKAIVDEIQFDIEDNIAIVDVQEEAYGAKGEYIFRQEAYPDEAFQKPSTFYRMPVYDLQSVSWKTPSLDKSMFLNPFAYALKEGYSSMRFGDLRAKNVVYLAANAATHDYDIWQENTDELRSAIYHTIIGKGKYRFSFKVDTPVSLYDNETKVGFVDSYSNLVELAYNLRFRNNAGVVVSEYRADSNKWEAGEFAEPNYWFADYASPEDYPVLMEFPECECSEGGVLELEIKNVLIYVPDPKNARGAYAQLKEIIVEDAGLDTISIPKSLTVTTKYNDRNNLRVHRNVKYGFNMGRVASPKSITNGMFVYKDSWFDASDNWKFNANDAPQPLSVLIHQQLLSYYSKPNNVLTGELITKNPDFCSLYEWKGKKHIITSGNLNILTGRMENAVLREYARYDHLWETWVEQDVYQVDYIPTTITARVFSKNFLVASDLQFPDWITGYVATESDDVYVVVMSVQGNNTGITRRGIVKIDSAYVLVEQFGAGDYGVDYGSDYS